MYVGISLVIYYILFIFNLLLNPIILAHSNLPGGAKEVEIILFCLELHLAFCLPRRCIQTRFPSPRIIRIKVKITPAPGYQPKKKKTPGGRNLLLNNERSGRFINCCMNYKYCSDSIREAVGKFAGKCQLIFHSLSWPGMGF